MNKIEKREVKNNMVNVIGGGNKLDLNPDENEMPIKEVAFNKMRSAFELLGTVKKSREIALVVTNLEQAMMWLNKDRTISGELKPYPGTHIESK